MMRRWYETWQVPVALSGAVVAGDGGIGDLHTESLVVVGIVIAWLVLQSLGIVALVRKRLTRGNSGDERATDTTIRELERAVAANGATTTALSAAVEQNRREIAHLATGLARIQGRLEAEDDRGG